MPVPVRVRQVAGPNVYFDLGTRHGVETGDTLAVAREAAGPVVGRLVVTASTETRSVMSFAGALFPVTRGEVLTLYLHRTPPEEISEVAVPVRRPSARESAAPVKERPPIRGRIALDFAGNHSSTRIGGADPVDIERTFATPALRVDATIPQAVSGFDLRTSFRMAYRYSDPSGVAPVASTRVYTAALERRFEGVPLRMSLGRFHSPMESYSGYWDGIFLRYGGSGGGVSALVGFEPDRWNERPSLARPKASVVLDAARRGEGWRWRGDLSVHTLRPTDSLPDHTFIGVSQRVSAGPLVLSQDLQMDRDPDDGAPRVSRLRVRGSLNMGGGLLLRAGLAHQETYLAFRLEAPFAPRRNRVDGGFSYRWSGGSLSGGASAGEDGQGRRTSGVTGAMSVRRLPGLFGAGGGATASYWSGPHGRSLSLAPSLDLARSRNSFRLGYRLFRSDYLDRPSTTHALEASVGLPLAPGVRLSARARSQWGGDLRNDALRITLYKAF